VDDPQAGVFAMSGLQTFRSQLGRLKLRRSFARWQTAVARGVVLDVIALFALLLLDFSLRLETTPRLFVIVAIGGVLVWRKYRHILPDLLHDETVVDIALLLERTHGVDNDLVAALQFDAATSGNVGSLTLQKAVIARAAGISETLEFRSAVPSKDARRATWCGAGAVLSVAIFWLTFPGHANAFWNRLWLGDAAYPTRTNIEDVAVNGRSDVARVVEGETVSLVVKCTGVTPNQGQVTLRGVETGEATIVSLKRIDESGDVVAYAADGPPLSEPVDFSVQIGDATTKVRRIEIIRRPLVELTIEAVAPAYMQRDDVRQHEHYVQVMEGSALELSVRCTNGKRLTNVLFQMTHDDDAAAEHDPVAFIPADDSGTAWSLAAKASGLTRVVNEFQFRIDATDEDGLGTYHPIEGAVRVKRDLAPTATISSQQHAVMPNAKPTISYAAEDDFGIGEMKLRVRRAGTREPNPAAPMRDGREPVGFSNDFDDVSSFELPSPESRGTSRSRALAADHVLDLAPFELVKGDKLLVWIEVTDYRGRWPGVSAVSESIELEILDERGVLDAILRSDADAEQMLTDVIEKELGLKGDR
jgi:hypothetical protein